MRESLRSVIESAKYLEQGRISEDVFKKTVFNYLSTEEEILPNMLLLLEAERALKKQLLLDTNAELSRSLVTLMDEKYAKKGAIVDRLWVVGEIKNHFLKWKDVIKCTFKIKGLP